MKIGEMFVINFEFFPRNRSGARTNLLPEFSSEEMILTRKIEIYTKIKIILPEIMYTCNNQQHSPSDKVA